MTRLEWRGLTLLAATALSSAGAVTATDKAILEIRKNYEYVTNRFADGDLPMCSKGYVDDASNIGSEKLNWYDKNGTLRLTDVRLYDGEYYTRIVGTYGYVGDLNFILIERKLPSPKHERPEGRYYYSGGKLIKSSLYAEETVNGQNRRIDPRTYLPVNPFKMLDDAIRKVKPGKCPPGWKAEP